MRAVAGFARLSVLLHPVFFVIYRLSVFNTVPRDDYAAFLLWLLGKPGGAFPDSPYCYRVLSMVLAAPLYVMPVIPLTNTPAGLTPEYLRATAALSMLAFLAWVACGMLGYAVARRASLPRGGALLAGALMLALVSYVQITAIDPVAVAMIAAGVLLVDRPAAFAALLAASVAVNEKVALVLACWLVIRCAISRADRTVLGVPALLAVAGVVAYLGMVRVLHFPGNAYQTEVGSAPGTVLANLAAYVSPRGVLLNLLPIAVLAGVALLGRPLGVFRRLDVLVIPALALVALVLTQFFQAGRIVMHAAPIFVAPAAAGAMAWLRGRGSAA